MALIAPSPLALSLSLKYAAKSKNRLKTENKNLVKNNFEWDFLYLKVIYKGLNSVRS